jgi:hypothetical protein
MTTPRPLALLQHGDTLVFGRPFTAHAPVCDLRDSAMTVGGGEYGVVGRAVKVYPSNTFPANAILIDLLTSDGIALSNESVGQIKGNPDQKPVDFTLLRNCLHLPMARTNCVLKANGKIYTLRGVTEGEHMVWTYDRTSMVTYLTGDLYVALNRDGVRGLFANRRFEKDEMITVFDGKIEYGSDKRKIVEENWTASVAHLPNTDEEHNFFRDAPFPESLGLLQSGLSWKQISQTMILPSEFRTRLMHIMTLEYKNRSINGFALSERAYNCRTRFGAPVTDKPCLHPEDLDAIRGLAQFANSKPLNATNAKPEINMKTSIEAGANEPIKYLQAKKAIEAGEEIVYEYNMPVQPVVAVHGMSETLLVGTTIKNSKTFVQTLTVKHDVEYKLKNVIVRDEREMTTIYATATPKGFEVKTQGEHRRVIPYESLPSDGLRGTEALVEIAHRRVVIEEARAIVTNVSEYRIFTFGQLYRQSVGRKGVEQDVVSMATSRGLQAVHTLPGSSKGMPLSWNEPVIRTYDTLDGPQPRLFLAPCADEHAILSAILFAYGWSVSESAWRHYLEHLARTSSDYLTVPFPPLRGFQRTGDMRLRDRLKKHGSVCLYRKPLVYVTRSRTIQGNALYALQPFVAGTPLGPFSGLAFRREDFERCFPTPKTTPTSEVSETFNARLQRYRLDFPLSKEVTVLPGWPNEEVWSTTIDGQNEDVRTRTIDYYGLKLPMGEHSLNYPMGQINDALYHFSDEVTKFGDTPHASTDQGQLKKFASKCVAALKAMPPINCIWIDAPTHNIVGGDGADMGFFLPADGPNPDGQQTTISITKNGGPCSCGAVEAGKLSPPCTFPTVVTTRDVAAHSELWTVYMTSYALALLSRAERRTEWTTELTSGGGEFSRKDPRLFRVIRTLLDAEDDATKRSIEHLLQGEVPMHTIHTSWVFGIGKSDFSATARQFYDMRGTTKEGTGFHFDGTIIQF